MHASKLASHKKSRKAGFLDRKVVAAVPERKKRIRKTLVNYVAVFEFISL